MDPEDRESTRPFFLLIRVLDRNLRLSAKTIGSALGDAEW